MENDKPQRSDWWDADVEHRAMNIVYQIGDALYEALPPDIAHEHFVKARQTTNDIAIDFAQKLIAGFGENVRRELKSKVEELRHDVTDCKHGPSDSCDQLCANQSWSLAYNTALDDLLSRLKNE